MKAFSFYICLFLLLWHCVSSLGFEEGGNAKPEPPMGVIKVHQNMEAIARFNASSVVNGYQTDWKTAKYVAYIETQFIDGKWVFCSGTVISKNAIITAAHCVKKSSIHTKTVRAYVGSAIPRSGPAFLPKSVYIQSGYDESSFLNDLAILRFSGRFSGSYSVAKLPNSKKKLPVETLVYTSGFGDLSNSGTTATSLQTVILRVENSYTCGKIFISAVKEILTPQNFFCVTDPRFPDVVERGSCYGDSGGPLYTKLPNGRMLVMGAYSFHMAGACIQTNQRHLYTNLVTRSSLIQSILKGSTSGWTKVIWKTVFGLVLSQNLNLLSRILYFRFRNFSKPVIVKAQ